MGDSLQPELVIVPRDRNWVSFAEIGTDRTISPLSDRMEWDRLVLRLYRELRDVAPQPGRIIAYEMDRPIIADDPTVLTASHLISLMRPRERILMVQLLPRDQEWKEGAIIEETMRDPTSPTWGVSTVLEGYMDRLDKRRFVRMRTLAADDLGAYMRGHGR